MTSVLIRLDQNQDENVVKEFYNLYYLVFDNEFANDLNRYLGLNIVELDKNQSTFFKDYMSNQWYNRGPMVKEIDVIHEQEGW